jgi:hypothetical protein
LFLGDGGGGLEGAFEEIRDP